MTPDQRKALRDNMAAFAAEFRKRWNSLHNITLADAVAERNQRWRSRYRHLRAQAPSRSAARCARMVYEEHVAEAKRDGLEPFSLRTVERVLKLR